MGQDPILLLIPALPALLADLLDLSVTTTPILPFGACYVNMHKFYCWGNLIECWRITCGLLVSEGTWGGGGGEAIPQAIGSLRNHDGDGDDNYRLKTNIYVFRTSLARAS